MTIFEWKKYSFDYFFIKKKRQPFDKKEDHIISAILN